MSELTILTPTETLHLARWWETDPDGRWRKQRAQPGNHANQTRQQK